MINLCQPNSAMRCQDTWTNIISECVYEGIFSQINTCTSRQQSRSPSLPWGASSNQRKAWTEQRAETVLLARSSSCLARCPSWLISPVLPLNLKFKKISSSWVSNHLAFQLLFTDSVLHQHASAQVFGIQLECHCGLSEELGQLGKILEPLSLHITWANSL